MNDCVLINNFNGKKQFDSEGNEIVVEKKRIYCGQVTRGSRRRMVDSVNLFCDVIKPRWIYNPLVSKRVKHSFAFVTLTIPFNDYRISGKDGFNNLLETFIFWLKKTKKVNTYIWKAELQQPLDFDGNLKKSNGQIHYHVLIPNFIHKNEIRDKWNYILRINGYLDGYYLSKGHWNAPSTSIERPYKVKNVAEYIVKEITKNCNSTKSVKDLEKKRDAAISSSNNDQVIILNQELDKYYKIQELNNQSLGGKVWGCSINLSPKKTIIPGKEEECKNLKKEIDKYINIMASKNISHDEYIWNNSQLEFLKKKRRLCYDVEKNSFEIEYTCDVMDNINALYNMYERSEDWVRNRNIWENDYVTVFHLPSTYREILLDRYHYIRDGGELKRIKYSKEYDDWLKKRVGVITLEGKKIAA